MEDQIIIHEPAQNARATEVREQLKTLTSQLEDSFFDTCDLLLEAHENQYHLDFGFTNFGLWIDNSGIGISSREARYYVNIASKALRLNVGRDVMKLVKISKLKEIFSLNPDDFEKEMQELLKMAPSMSLDEVKAAVRKLKLEDGQEDSFFMTIKGPLSAKPVIEQGLETAKQVGGFDDDVPNGRLLELICADFNSGVHDAPESVEEVPEQIAEEVTISEDLMEDESAIGIVAGVEFNEDGSLKESV